MADKFLKQLNIGGQDYILKDAKAQADIAAEAARAAAAEATKQDIIDDSNKLAAAYVSLVKPAGSKLTSSDVQDAVYELEAAIETGGTGSVVNVIKKETAESGFFATYEITQGGEKVGASINIPKDFLVKSAELKTVTKADEPYEGAKVGDKYIDFVINVKEGTATDEHIYLPVNELVDAYLADEQTIHMENNTFSVKAVPMNLVTGLQDALDLKADEADLVAEIARAEAAEALKEDKSALKALAYQDTATGTGANQQITGVKATGDLEGSASITLASTETDASLTKGDFTPAGTITGEAIKGGSIEVTLKDAAAPTAASLDTADYTPSGAVKVTLKNNTFKAITSVGTLPTKAADSWTANVPTVVDTTKFNGGSAATWTGKSWTPAALTDQSKGDFVSEAIVVDSYDEANETLTFKAAPTAKAVTDRGSFTADVVNFGTFDGGSAASLADGFYTAGSAAQFSEGEFSQGTLPNMAEQTVDVNSATFEGDPETDLKVNGVTYMKQVVDTKTFNSEPATLGFAGAKADNVLVTGVKYDKANASQSGTVAIEDAELAVGTINVAGQTITVS